MVKKIIFTIAIIVFFTIPDQSYCLDLPPVHGYGVPQAMDALNKSRERRRQERREKELYQQQLKLQEQRAKQQLERQKQRSKEKKESMIFDIIVDKASKGTMTDNDKKYLEKHMGYEPANIIWDFNESNK